MKKRDEWMNIDKQDEYTMDELGHDLKRIAEATNKLGHAAFDAVPQDGFESSEEKKDWEEMQERGRVLEFAKSLSAEFGIEIIEIESNPDDPPDCFAKRAGDTIGIEVTELVKRHIRERIAESRPSQRKPIPYSPNERFADELWTRDEFTKKIGESVAKKDASATKKNKTLDVLLIYTDEGDLPPERLEDWLSNERFSATNIKEIFLIRSYWPGYKEYWPLFKLNIEQSEVSTE